eukprot:TRINITY_DN46039_c0_g1_i2.p3 TRINITY_DN46039_c0_g1~~TRINITY_DN46039_c0_g1_i2.p3  ORF type:complete len:157 (+),score=30.06 TRINITY_DN46039_c0_g1_i2:312-782(+)
MAVSTDSNTNAMADTLVRILQQQNGKAANTGGNGKTQTTITPPVKPPPQPATGTTGTNGNTALESVVANSPAVRNLTSRLDSLQRTVEGHGSILQGLRTANTEHRDMLREILGEVRQGGARGAADAGTGAGGDAEDCTPPPAGFVTISDKQHTHHC